MDIPSNTTLQQYSVPILFMVFNRPDKTEITFNQIRKQKPRVLYVAADGPRSDREGEKEKCEQVRSLVHNIDWPCSTKYLFRDKNLGCYNACLSAINWFFSEVEMGIIIEDDCLPHTSFFPYCEELLKKYKDDDRIMMISGTNLNIESGSSSYYFSRYGQIWGWATWRKSWLKFEPEMDVNNKRILFNNKNEEKYWRKNFTTPYWDVQWAVYSMWLNNGLAVMPNTNLVTNIGFGKEATHYVDENSITAGIDSKSITFPLIHPHDFVVDAKRDNEFFYKYYYQSYSKRIINKLKRILNL